MSGRTVSASFRAADREMQKAGILVFRFTGSEIYHRGRERAQEVADHVSGWISKVYDNARRPGNVNKAVE